MTTDPWGIDDGYWDVAGVWRTPAPGTIGALRAAMGGEYGDERPPDPRPTWVVRAGAADPLLGPADLVLEDGASMAGVTALPPDLPLGYHDLRPLDGGPTTRLIVAPRRCHLPADLRTWGLTVQLYAARSRTSWGLGDLADLRRIGEWSAGAGAGMLAVNPLHGALPLPAQQPSPYYPSSRRYRNPLYLRVEEVPGAAEVADVERLAAAGRGLNGDRRIDRDEVFALKSAALEALWERFPGDPAFDRWLAERGDDLAGYATFCALCEHHGSGWNEWPEEHRRPGSPAVGAFARSNDRRVGYHGWLQWLLDRQVQAAGEATPLVHDLAIGVDPAGADAWQWQEVLATGVRVGAPPDEFNTTGQDWGLPPFVPWRLRAAGYDPFVQTVRSGLRHAGGLRFDHVMGLFRLFWIPEGRSPADGTYVRYHATDLLDILALESVRAGAFVVGEDLGTVEPWIREALTDRGVLSYRLLWFEEGDPSGYPRQALAAVTTHDLPTVAGLWTGSDLEVQRELDLEPNEESTAKMRDRLATMVGADDDTPVGDVVVGAYRLLATAPSMVLSATLDDALGVEERPNVPGTISEWPNWSLGLPVPLEDALASEQVKAVADALSERRPAPTA
ncbi:MAG TPA: 4-alpha-glucanotransferase [Acidimicrobiales bacterium]